MTTSTSSGPSTSSGNGFVRACAVADLGPESALAVAVGRTDVAIVHSDGSFYAIADECSHAAIPLSDGDVEHGEIECYLHGSRFDLRTGEPKGVPAVAPIPVYACKIEDDAIWVDMDQQLNDAEIPHKPFH